MSTWFDEPVRCPACALEQTARLAHGVHIARAPEIRDQIFARTFHAITCRGCAHVFVAQRPLIYTDMDRKHWIQVVLPEERARWPEYEVAVDDVFARAFIGSPLARELADRMRRRLVFGLEALREKLVVWAANLDDRAIECVKLELVRREPALAHATLIVDAIAADHALTLRVGERTIAVDGALVEAFDADRRLPARFPELFGGRYVAFDRLLGPRYRWAEPG
jgi:hypothetical protein